MVNKFILKYYKESKKGNYIQFQNVFFITKIESLIYLNTYN